MYNLDGKTVAELLFEDIEEMFDHSVNFKINKEFNSSSVHYASLRGQGDKARVCLSKDFCNFKIDNINDLFFSMIIICHEVAHYLNKHNEYEDTCSNDFTAIETWADFFGAKIFVTAISFGENSKSIIEKFIGEIDQKLVLKAMGKAMGKLYESIYLPNTESKYPVAIERVLLFNAGVTSFFYRIYGELKPEWTLYVLKTILNEADLISQAGAHNTDGSNHAMLSSTTSNIHKAIQGGESAITKGLKIEYIPILITNYNLSEEQIQQGQEILKKQVDNLGLN